MQGNGGSKVLIVLYQGASNINGNGDSTYRKSSLGHLFISWEMYRLSFLHETPPLSCLIFLLHHNFAYICQTIRLINYIETILVTVLGLISNQLGHANGTKCCFSWVWGL